MKTHTQLLCAVASLAFAAVGFAADSSSKPNESAEVTFSHPEKFADVRDSYMGSEKGRDGLLAEIKEYIQFRAKSYLSAGQKLVMNVTDVDLAGDYEPWRGPDATDVRIVKDIYPPKIDFDFKVVDASGAVVQEGKRQLRDLAFMMKISIMREDNLRFEKAMIDDWFQKDFPKSKKS